MEYSFAALIIIALILFFAASTHGSIGFGFPLLATPLLALGTDLQSAILLTLIPTILVNIVSITSEGNFLLAFRRNISTALLAMLGSAIGTLILIVTHSEVFKLLLAVAIFTYLIADRVKISMTWVREFPESAKIIFGFSAGLLGGLTNVMAPVLIIYSLESKHSKSDLNQLSNLCFLLGKIIQLFMFSIFGQYTIKALSISPIMLVVVSLALYVGVHVKKKIRAHTYIRILRAFLLLLATLLLMQIAA